ncbi:MAG: alpha/beta hydrolase [Hyphomonadaceae bacterium]|nr:alpha/beta hydrolase [Hyphomonadaceae bacterium]
MEVLGEDPDGFSAAIDLAPASLGEALEADSATAPAGPAFVRPDGFASAACDAEGRLIHADPAFRAWVLPRDQVRAALDRFDPDRPTLSFLVEDRGKFIAVAAAPLAHTRGWPLSGEVIDSLRSGKAQVAILAKCEEPGSSAMAALFRDTLGLTGLEARVCAGLVRMGDARRAALSVSVTYETSRDALKTAMRKAGVSGQAALVGLLVRLSAGELSGGTAGAVICDTLGLTPRQARIALAYGDGNTHAAVARLAGVSAHVVKAELASVYTQLGVSTAAGLSRALGQIAALSGLAEASSVDLLPDQSGREPLRMLPRRGGRQGRIAFSDHGPAGGHPTVIIHTATTGRHLPARHVAELQAHGLRPITFDRPGTGLSDMVDTGQIDHTAHDIADILDSLGIERASVIARGGSMALTRFAALHPHRLDRGVALNPEPHPKEDRSFAGYFGTCKRLVFQQPALIEAMARHLSQRASRSTVAAMVKKALAASPADTATLEQPDFMAAYVRATQQAALQQGAGLIAISRWESQAHDIPLDDGRAITILAGDQDPLYRHEAAMARWSKVWPGCQIEILADAGRLLQFQHPGMVAAAALGRLP